MRMALLMMLSVSALAAPEACDDLCGRIEACSALVDHADLSNLLCRVARCETGETCKKDMRSPNGIYRGPFQFSRRTWRVICSPMFKAKKIKGCAGKEAISEPCCATMCVAEMVAENLNGGLKNWPACGRKAQRDIAREAKD